MGGWWMGEGIPRCAAASCRCLPACSLFGGAAELLVPLAWPWLSCSAQERHKLTACWNTPSHLPANPRPATSLPATVATYSCARTVRSTSLMTASCTSST